MMHLNTKLVTGIAVLLSLAFGAAGIMKLTGGEQVLQSFSTLGLPGWFGYFIGASEVAGAIGIHIKVVRRYAAAGLIIIMIGAFYYHLTNDPIVQTIPAIVLGLMALVVGMQRLPEAPQEH